ncbi:MAG: ubiquinol-cytochrome C chaperone [Rhodospirillaceae bacterium]|nr:ubiquinol-cytochrome C chaperone [Rhodospirillaceae bacterium]
MFNWLKPRLVSKEVDLTYNVIVNQARKPMFYQDIGVADTLDGRFDLLGLHICVLFYRLKSEGEQANIFSQDLFDVMFTDMDRSLRELGVGDLSVGRRVKEMGRALLGRLEAYDRALDSDFKELENVLTRNVYRGNPNMCRQVGKLASYVKNILARLEKTPTDVILRGKFSFENGDD